RSENKKNEKAEEMARPNSSCFKIIGCGGGDAVDNDELAHGEDKASSDKHRWSFCRRSSKHRVLSNTAVSEPISVCSSKDNQEISTINFNSPKYSLPERAEVQEKPIETAPSSSGIVNTEAPPSSSNRSITPAGSTLNQYDAIVIQAAIRAYLAEKRLLKLKIVVKLQAAIRGYLVKRQAIGSLRCIQAIIRMQSLIRARHAHKLIGKLTSPEEKFQEKGDSFVKSNKASNKLLLSNGLVRQLLETTPRTKTIYIKCDPSKSDSAWKWLEIWTALISSGVGKQQEQNLNHDNWSVEENANMVESEPAKENPYAASSLLSDSPAELILADGKRSSVIENVGNFEFQTPVIAPNNSFNPLLRVDVENSELKNELFNTMSQDCKDTKMVNKENMDCVSDNKQLQPNQSLEILVTTVPDKLQSVRDSSKHSAERASSETLEKEGKKFVIVSRKPCNPAFVAAQSKFEELSSMSNVGRSVSSAAALKSKTESHSIQNNSFTNNNEAISAENLIFNDSKIQAAVSECGTEISISSTLDSPDKSETEGGEIVIEIGALEKENYAIIADAENAFDLSNLGANRRPDGTDQSMANLNASINLPQVDQHPAEPTNSNVPTHVEGMLEQARSPEGTPRSLATVPDLHGTPSSDVSVNAKKSQKDNDTPAERRRSQSIGKRSPSKPNNDSSGRSSTDRITKDSKIPKRRNSFGIAKTDHVDQEPRLSSSNSLPGYMQATASARARAHVNTSPKSSPDLHDSQPKKRHSLPIENGKQNSSPHMQSSASQAQQSAKGNEAHSPHNSAGELLIPL
ncbi:unnamed protein product, partial [Musa hybrid cultivar]